VPLPERIPQTPAAIGHGDSCVRNARHSPARSPGGRTRLRVPLPRQRRHGVPGRARGNDADGRGFGTRGKVYSTYFTGTLQKAGKAAPRCRLPEPPRAPAVGSIRRAAPVSMRFGQAFRAPRLGRTSSADGLRHRLRNRLPAACALRDVGGTCGNLLAHGAGQLDRG